jgi:hypothetical protein
VTYAKGGDGTASGAAGTTNLGNGGDGGAAGDTTGGTGGSGIVIITYPTGSMTTTGGDVVDTTTIPGTTIVKFTSTGASTFTVTSIN